MQNYSIREDEEDVYLQQEVNADEMKSDLLDMIQQEIERESKVAEELAAKGQPIAPSVDVTQAPAPRKKKKRTTVVPPLAANTTEHAAVVNVDTTVQEISKSRETSKSDSVKIADKRLIHQWEKLFEELDTDHDQKVQWGEILDTIAELIINKSMPSDLGTLTRNKVKTEVNGIVNTVIGNLEVDAASNVSFAEFVRFMKSKTIKEARFRGIAQTIGLTEPNSPAFFRRVSYVALMKGMPAGVFPIVNHRQRVIGLMGKETWFTMFAGLVTYIKFRHDALSQPRVQMTSRKVISKWLMVRKLRTVTLPEPVYLGPNALLVKRNFQAMQQSVFRQWRLIIVDGCATGARSLYPTSTVPAYRQRQRLKTAAKQVKLPDRARTIATAVLIEWFEHHLKVPTPADMTFEALSLGHDYDRELKIHRVRVLQLNLPSGLHPKLDKEGDLIGFQGVAPKRDILKALVLYEESCVVIREMIKMEDSWGVSATNINLRRKVDATHPTELYTDKLPAEDKSLEGRQRWFESIHERKLQDEEARTNPIEKGVDQLRFMCREEPDPSIVPFDQWGTEDKVVPPPDEERFIDESTMLNRFFYKTRGKHWRRSANWCKKTKHLNSWEGVATDDEGWVVSLCLRRNQLTGTLPRAICNLRRLQVLDLRNNHELKGMLPEEINFMFNLRVLSLDGCPKLSGDLPTTITQLEHLAVLSVKNCEGLEGVLPVGLDEMTSLEELNFHGCFRLGGQIPQKLGQLPNLKFVSFAHCAGLDGPIPPDLGKSRRLNMINLLNCSGLTGPLPECIAFKGIVHDHIEFLDVRGCPGLTDAQPKSFVREHKAADAVNPRDRVFGGIAATEEMKSQDPEQVVVEDTESEPEVEEDEGWEVYREDESVGGNSAMTAYHQVASAFTKLKPSEQQAYLDALSPAQLVAFQGFLGKSRNVAAPPMPSKKRKSVLE